ncbi:MAG: serine--tRNA ligase [bacterium]|nr:serine--tRNA ligase [bacterium]
MIDGKILRDSFAVVAEQLRTRGLPEDFHQWPKLDEERRRLVTALQELRTEKKALNPEIARARKAGEDVSALFERLRESGQKEKELEVSLQEVEEKLKKIELTTPNIPHESVPVGTSEADNRIEKTWGTPRKFEFTPKNHWDIGEALDILDFERAAKLSGARFVIYKGDGARLERAIAAFMLDEHRKRGYTEIIPPILVREEAMIGSGQLPKFADDAFKTANEIPFYLIPTSEVALCNLHADEILAEDELPLNYTSFTPCFRAEAGSYGKDVRGLIRLHQFNKVELVKITDAATSFVELENITSDAENILEKLELPYRRMTLCTGDAGIASAKTHDLEVWLPGQSTYREISSCTNTTDYQARRMKVRYRSKESGKPEFAHLLNGSGLAVGRTFVAILENYQTAEGEVVIPEVLRPYMGGQEIIRRA